jgi:hypothetical protein
VFDSLASGLAVTGQLSGPQVEAAFAAFSAILSAAEARRSQRSKVGSVWLIRLMAGVM